MDLNGQIHSSVVFLDLGQVYFCCASATFDEMTCFLHVALQSLRNHLKIIVRDQIQIGRLSNIYVVFLLSQSTCECLVYVFLNEFKNNADQIQNYCCLDMLVFCLCTGLILQFLFPYLADVFTLTTPDKCENDEN